MTQSIEAAITGVAFVGEDSPRGALADFYRAFNARDLAGVADNWARNDDIAMANPLGGIRRGWDAISEVYARLFAGPAKVYVEFHDYTLHEYADVFLAIGRERGRFQRDGVEVALAIRTSRTYQRIDGRWRQVHHHGSIAIPPSSTAISARFAANGFSFPTQKGETP